MTGLPQKYCKEKSKKMICLSFGKYSLRQSLTRKEGLSARQNLIAYNDVKDMKKGFFNDFTVTKMIRKKLQDYFYSVSCDWLRTKEVPENITITILQSCPCITGVWQHLLWLNENQSWIKGCLGIRKISFYRKDFSLGGCAWSKHKKV